MRRLLVLLLLASLSCGGERTERTCHVLLITVDTLRSDHVGKTDTPLPTTPFLDDLLDGGTRFPNTIAPVPRTTPSLASLLTGAYPHRTGVRWLGGVLGSGVAPLAQILRTAGFFTVAVVSNHVLTADRQLYRGFHYYDTESDWRDARRTTDRALAYLDKPSADTSRVFLWVHYIDPHVPYLPPQELARGFDPGYEGRYALHFGSVQGGIGDYAYPKDLPKREAVFRNPLSPEVNRHIRRLYAADVRNTDDEIARLVAGVRARLGDDLLTVFTSDHGESLGEHDFYYDHGDYVYNATLRVPLGIVPPPGDPLAGTREIHDWVSLVDVTPTLLDLLGVEGPAGQFEGRSLVPYLEGGHPEPQPVFAECGRSFFPELVRKRTHFDVPGRFRAAVEDGWKLIWTPGLPEDEAFELYDLAADPGETRNLYDPSHPRAASLREALTAWLMDGGPATEERDEPTEKDRELLKSLGYID